MRVTHESHVFTINFLHEQFDEPQVRFTLHRGARMFRAMTSCTILGANGPSPIGISGFAWCADEDRFCKETGRQIALKRAVQDLPREVRGAILYAYFTRHEQDRQRAV